MSLLKAFFSFLVNRRLHVAKGKWTWKWRGLCWAQNFKSTTSAWGLKSKISSWRLVLSLNCYSSWGQRGICAVITVSPEQEVRTFFGKQWKDKIKVLPPPLFFIRKEETRKEGRKRRKGRRIEETKEKTPNISFFPTPINDSIKLSRESKWYWPCLPIFLETLTLLHKVPCVFP